MTTSAERQLPQASWDRIVPTLSADSNKELVKQFYEEVWARGNVEFTENVFAPEYIRHDLRPTQAAPGSEGQAQIARAVSPMPTLHWRVDLLVAEGISWRRVGRQREHTEHTEHTVDLGVASSQPAAAPSFAG